MKKKIVLAVLNPDGENSYLSSKGNKAVVLLPVCAVGSRGGLALLRAPLVTFPLAFWTLYSLLLSPYPLLLSSISTFILRGPAKDFGALPP